MNTPHRKFVVDMGWQAILEGIGLAPGDVLRHAGLPRDLFSQKKPELTVDEYFRLWESMEFFLGDPLFPLKLAQSVTAESFSPPLFAALCSPNLQIALRRLAHYKPLIGPLTLNLEENDRMTVAHYGNFEEHALPVVVAATELVFLVHLARLATRRRIEPVRVELVQPPADLPPYEEFFGVEVTRGASNAVAFSHADCLRPFVTVNEAMFSVFEPVLGARLEELRVGADFRDRVRACLLEALPSGQTSMADIAGRLAVSARTLQRRLSEAGSSFQDELNATRERLARHYLATTEYTSAEISFLLGYNDPSSFIRAFHSWTGQTPQAVRSNGGLH
jgi:AraC-like DNA-binding protein